MALHDGRAPWRRLVGQMVKARVLLHIAAGAALAAALYLWKIL